MADSYFMVQVYFQNKWVDLVGGKYVFDSTDEKNTQLALEYVTTAFNHAEKRAKDYRHRIIKVSVIKQTQSRLDAIL
jgi:hypothetical protein